MTNLCGKESDEVSTENNLNLDSHQDEDDCGLVMMEVPITTVRQSNEMVSVINLYRMAVSHLSQKRHKKEKQTTCNPSPTLQDPCASPSQSQQYGIPQSSILS